MLVIPPGPIKSGVQPIGVPEIANLEVLPYIRGRLTFAELTARQLAFGRHDLLLVDLPRFMNNPAWLNVPLNFFPLISLVTFKRTDGTFRAIPFSPNDAACIAASHALRQTLRFRCIDDPDLLNYPANGLFSPQVSMGDDYFLWHKGLEEFFRPLWLELDKAWSRATSEMKFFTRYRASTVLRHLRVAARSGKRCILVCEYQLWWAIRKALESPLRDIKYIFRWKKTPATLRIEDPYFAWAQGLLDDYPALVAGFWERFLANEVGSFDKSRLLESTIDDVLTGRSREEKTDSGQASIRSKILFRKYLRRLTTVTRRVIPEPGGQLYHAAEACGGQSFLKQLAKSLFHYPQAADADRIRYLLQGFRKIEFGESDDISPSYDELHSFHTGKPFFQEYLNGMQSSPLTEMEDRRRIVDRVRPKLTPREEEDFLKIKEECGVCFATKKDYALHKQACDQSHFLALAQRCTGRPRRCQGSIEGGIHWKATLAAMARAEKALYVKRRHDRKRMITKLHEYTPVVFLLSSEEEIDNSCSFSVYDSNPARRNCDLGNGDFPFDRYPKPDAVYSLYCTRKHYSEFTLGGHIERRPITSITTLYTGQSMGVQRYDAITKRTARYQCRKDPAFDPEISSFPLSQRGIAWAVKYAEDVVLVVAARGWRPSAVLADYARTKKIRLSRVDMSGYHKEFLNRLTSMYFISSKLKKHPDHERISNRFMDYFP